jgi:hypothetical protein
MSEYKYGHVMVPRRFLDEVCIALAAASIIATRDGAAINHANHERLRREAVALMRGSVYNE